MRKPRSDAVLLNLPEEQQCKLADWLLSGVPYHEAKILAEKEFGVSLKSLSPFKEFWAQVCEPLLLLRRSRTGGAANQRAAEAERNPMQFDRATMDALGQKAFEVISNPSAKANEIRALLGLFLKARDQDMEDRRIKLLEADAAKAQAAEKVTKSEMTPEEKAAAMKRIFGM